MNNFSIILHLSNHHVAKIDEASSLICKNVLINLRNKHQFQNLYCLVPLELVSWRNHDRVSIPRHVLISFFYVEASNFDIIVKNLFNALANKFGHSFPISELYLLQMPFSLKRIELDSFGKDAELAHGPHSLVLFVKYHIRVHPKLLDLIILY